MFSRRADSLAGLNTELRFHVDSDTTVQFAGLAIDDVSVTACRALSADLQITKTDGVATATPGGSVTYTITASTRARHGDGCERRRHLPGHPHLQLDLRRCGRRHLR
ncbi:MAG: hypothetical protein HC897_17580, partial [Thermoanaerobaculia bacterium]|nr:hypothetical protein [Thermoanaerobaculia bacterium]